MPERNVWLRYIHHSAHHMDCVLWKLMRFIFRLFDDAALTTDITWFEALSASGVNNSVFYGMRPYHLTRASELALKGRFAHNMPCSCRAARSLECVFPIWFTQCGRVWFTLAMPCPCYAPTMLFFSRPRHSTPVERRPVGYQPAFGFSWLPRRVPRRLLSDAYDPQMQVATVKPNAICHGRG